MKHGRGAARHSAMNTASAMARGQRTHPERAASRLAGGSSGDVDQGDGVDRIDMLGVERQAGAGEAVASAGVNA